jgi:hypothetical protein
MRSYPFVTRAAITSFLIVVATVALTSGIAAAPDGDESVNHCTIGEAEAAFQAWVPAVKLWNGLGIDQGALGEGYWLCQYRSFRDGAEVCFCEDDIFLGGSTLYELLEGPDALSRPEARESIAAWEFRVFITPDGGQESELDVMRTAIKGGLHPVWGAGGLSATWCLPPVASGRLLDPRMGLSSRLGRV